MSSTYGKKFTLSLFGQSDKAQYGVLIDGVAPGTAIDERDIIRRIDSFSDGGVQTRVVSGIKDGKTTGAPVCALFTDDAPLQDVRNTSVARPGTPDFGYFARFRGANADEPGEKHLPGLVFAGALAKAILARRDIEVHAHLRSIGEIEDTPFTDLPLSRETFDVIGRGALPVYDKRKEVLMKLKLEKTKGMGDTIGGSVECAVTGLPAGAGSPVLNGIDAHIAGLLFALPGICGVSFGDPAAPKAYGSEQNDELFIDTLKGCPATRTNHCGGVLGGITTGMPLLCTASFRPSPLIGIEQNTVDLNLKHSVVLPPLTPNTDAVVRMVPAVEGALAAAVLDALLTK